MNQEEINNLLTQILDNSKYSNATGEQKEAIKKKLVLKYLNDLNFAALEYLDPVQQKEFSEILATQNTNDIQNFLVKNITDLDTVTKKAAQKFSEDVFLILKN